MRSRSAHNSERHKRAFIKWWEEPPTMVRELFGADPDGWQDRVLADFPSSQKQALVACKGPGKTCVEAWLAWNYLLTRPHAQIAATSITGQNLQDGLWKEMAHWRNKSELLKSMFEWQRNRIYARQNPETWFMSARTWDRKATSEVQAQTLAGFHADYVMFILDETGGMPLAVMAAAEAALATGIECHIMQAGNPTQIGGALHASVTRGHGWRTYHITGDPDDPDRASRVDVKWARDMIAQYGRESPYVLANVFGRFPPGGINQLIPLDVVETATRRHYRDFDLRGAPRILGVDVAREGDDSSIIFPREGLAAYRPLQYRNIDSLIGAGEVSRKWDEWEADACFIDATGGFGWGWIDQLKRQGYAPIPVHYNGNAHLKERYFNKRTEMAMELKGWLERGGAIPDIPELSRALTEITYGYKENTEQMILEPKSDLKDRLGFSPDHMDALMQTFAEPVTGARRRPSGAPPRYTYDWQPFGSDMHSDPGFERPY